MHAWNRKSFLYDIFEEACSFKIKNTQKYEIEFSIEM